MSAEDSITQEQEMSWIEKVFADCKARVAALPPSVVKAERQSGRIGRDPLIERRQ